MLLPAGKKIMARQDGVELQFAAQPAFGVMCDSHAAAPRNVFSAVRTSSCGFAPSSDAM
jgi:hypothetical protein